MQPQRSSSSSLGPRAPKFSTNIEALSVQRTSSGKSLQDFLAERLGLSRRAAKAVIDGRSVWVNRRCVWIAHHKLATGDLVELPRTVVTAARRQAGSARAVVEPEERTHVRVLAETPHYVVADKPAGILANADAKSVESILRVQLNEPSLQAVHRLDRDTTGCILFARSFAAYQAAVEVFKTRRVEKTYRAIVAGAFPYACQKIDAPIDDHFLRDARGRGGGRLVPACAHRDGPHKPDPPPSCERALPDCGRPHVRTQARARSEADDGAAADAARSVDKPARSDASRRDDQGAFSAAGGFPRGAQAFRDGEEEVAASDSFSVKRQLGAWSEATAADAAIL